MSADLYKYRVGKKWFTFDKNILEPEDLRVFNLANWSDKLKIITIYNDLKPIENDDVVILKTKTEKANKDKRAQEYREKKQRLNQQLTAANETNNEAEQQKILKQLQQLDIDYADVVSIQTAETVNIARANQVILNDVNELVKQTSETLDQLKTSLTTEDFKQLNNLVKKLLDTSNKQQLEDTITQIKNTLTNLNDASLIPAVNKGVKIMTDTMEQLKDTIDDIKESETVNKLLELGLLNDIDEEKQPYLKTLSMILSKIEKLNISEDDLSILSRYPQAIDYLKKQKNPFKVINPLCYLINFYVEWLGLKKDNDITAIGFDKYKTERATKGKFKYNITEPGEFENFVDTLKISDGNDKLNLFYKYGGKDIKQFVGTYNFNKTTSKQGTYEIVKTIVDNKKVAEVDKTAAVEGEGFLGLKTNRAAKQDYKNLMDIITNVKKQVEEMAEEITTLKGLINPAAAQKLREVKQQPINQQPTFKEVNPIQQAVQHSPTFKPESRSFLTDITEKPRLKHIEPVERTPEITDLERLMNKRRQDIEPDSYSEDDDEEWADGLKVKNCDAVARPEGSRVGGILGELQRDLNKYGLVLSLSPDKNAYFINVFNRKNRGSGVEEATKLVNAVDENTEYKDLKKLYESLY